MKYAYTVAEGEIVVNPECGVRYRILYLMRDEAVVFNVDAPVAPKSVPPSQRKKMGCNTTDLAAAKSSAKLALPELMPLNKLIQWPKEQWVANIRLPDSFTEAEKRFHTRATGVVELLHKNEPDIYFPKSRATLIALAVGKFGVTQRTVWKYLRAYWRAGKDLSALISDLSNCGASGKLRIPGSAKRGRPRSQYLLFEIGAGINVQPSDQPHIKRAVAWYRSKPKATLDDAYLWMLDACYSGPYEEPDGTKAWGANPLTVLNFPQFEYHCKRYFDVIDKERREAEKDKGGKIARERHHGVQVGRYEIGTIAELDALHGNMSLVSADRTTVLGGMVVFIVVEYGSGLVLGFSVGWDAEAYEPLADALVKCVSDKVEWCANYGIEIGPEEWPAQHWPQHFHADRGSAFMCRMADRIIEVLRPNPFANTPPMSPESKGIVENTVKLIKLVFNQMYPGTWLAKIGSQKRGAPNPHKYAALTRDEFIRAFMMVVLKVNQKVRNTATEPQRVARGVPNTPAAIYLDACQTHRHRLRPMDPLKLASQLLSRMPATVSDQGIYLGNELYYLPDDNRHLSSTWFRKLAHDEGRVFLALNRDVVDIAYLCLSSKDGDFIPCSLSPRSHQFLGRSLWEVMRLRTRQNELNKVEEHNSLTQRVAHNASMRSDGEEAMAKTRAATGNIPSSERDISNRQENRQQERAMERQKLADDMRRQHGVLPPPASPPVKSARDPFAYPAIKRK